MPLAATNLEVFIDGIEISSGYAITNVGIPASTIIFAVAPVDQTDIYLQLNVPFERLNDYNCSWINNGKDRLHILGCLG